MLLLRHGATRANITRPYTLQGQHEDNELIDEGSAQARSAAHFLTPFPIVKVYCSPLKRARLTGEIIAERLGVACESRAGLVEVDVGKWAGLTWEQVQAGWPDAAAAFHENPEKHGYLDGENLEQVLERVLPVVRNLISRHENEIVVVIGHGVVNRVLLAHWMGLPLQYARRLPQDNTGINLIDFHGENAKVRTVNTIAHLIAQPPL